MRRTYVPKEYQPPVTQHMIETPRCGAWLPMGMGKTISTLTALDIMYLCGRHTRPTLVCAPLRVAKNTWPSEIEKWDHIGQLQAVSVTGDSSERFHVLYKELKRGNVSVFTINYENLPWLEQTLKETGTQWPFGTIVADESTKLKGFRLKQGTQRAKALARVAHKHVDRFIELTGTPAPNGLKDLWGQAWFLDQGKRLGRSFTSFSERWFRSTRDGFGIEPMPHAQEEIESLLGDLCLSLDPHDYFDLEAPIEFPIYVDLPPKARKIYDDMEKKMFAQIGEHEVEAFNAASKSMKCLQVANGAAYVEVEDDPTDTKPWVQVHDAKLQALEDIIEEAAGMPVLVSYHFKSDLARLKKAFPQGRYFDDKKQTEDDWNAGKIPVMFIHPASGGHGLNLQDGGNIIVMFAHWWDFEQYQQVIERIGPMRQMQSGHDRPVFIYHIIARDTVDEIVMQRREGKKGVHDLLMEAMKRRGA